METPGFVLILKITADLRNMIHYNYHQYQIQGQGLNSCVNALIITTSNSEEFYITTSNSEEFYTTHPSLILVQFFLNLWRDNVILNKQRQTA